LSTVPTGLNRPGIPEDAFRVERFRIGNPAFRCIIGFNFAGDKMS